MKQGQKLNHSIKPRVLIISDRYPPDSHGGAEVSLHLAVQNLASRGTLVQVVAFSDNSRVTWDNVDGVPVCRIPFPAAWPPQSWWLAANYLNKIKRPIPRKIAAMLLRYTGCLEYLLVGKRRNFFQKIRLLLLRRSLSRELLQKSPFPLVDIDILGDGRTLNILRKVIDDFCPDIIHADNYRSILVTSRIVREHEKFIAVVRDNRFFCAIAGQSMNIDGKVCEQCSYECVDNIPERFKEGLGRLISETLSTRRESLLRADHIVVTSRYLEAGVKHFCKERPVSVIPNPADNLSEVNKFQKGIETANPPEILCVGMLNENKGQHVLLECFAELREKVGDFRIIFAGRGQIQKTFNAENETQKIQDMIVFSGFLSREELYRAYARCSVVVCPGLWPEPFGRVPLEAGLSKKPVVAFALGGYAENIIHDETGMLVDPLNKTALVESLVKILKNPALGKALGENNYRHVLEHFTVEKNTALLEKLWVNLLSPKR